MHRIDEYEIGECCISISSTTDTIAGYDATPLARGSRSVELAGPCSGKEADVQDWDKEENAWSDSFLARVAFT